MTVARLHTVGGSEIAAVCGLDPYTSATTLAARKLGLIPAQEETPAMRIGKKLEPLIAELATEDGWQVTPYTAATFKDPERKWCTGRPDGYVELEGDTAVAEFKAVGQLAHREGWNDAPPLRYQAQCQWYLHLTGYPSAVVFALVGGQRFETYTVERDDDAIGVLLDLAEGFVKLLRRGKLPDPDGSDSARTTLVQLFPEHEPATAKRLSKAGYQAVKELRLVREAEAHLAEQRAFYENAIKLEMGDAESALSPHDDIVATWKTFRSARIDSKALRAAHPRLADEFSAATSTRRFLVA